MKKEGETRIRRLAEAQFREGGRAKLLRRFAPGNDRTTNKPLIN
jgi:hypothetical protein